MKNKDYSCAEARVATSCKARKREKCGMFECLLIFFFNRVISCYNTNLLQRIIG